MPSILCSKFVHDNSQQNMNNTGIRSTGWSPQKFAFKYEVIGCKGVQTKIFWTFAVKDEG